MSSFDIVLLAAVVAWLVAGLADRALIAYRVRLHSKNVAAHGWPPMYVDADGEPAEWEDEAQ